jgi:hypothetical protein
MKHLEMNWQVFSTGFCKRIAALLAAVVLPCPGSAAAATPPGYDELEIIAKLRAIDLFPDCVNTGSPLNVAMEHEAEVLEKRNPAYFDRPDWPLILVRTVARRLSIEPRSEKEIAASDPGMLVVKPQTMDLVITKATFGSPRVEFDVTRKIAKMVVDNTLEVRSSVELLPGLANLDDFASQEGESPGEFFRKQTEMMHFEAVHHVSAPVRSGTSDAPAETAILKVTYKIGARSGSVEAREGTMLRLP